MGFFGAKRSHVQGRKTVYNLPFVSGCQNYGPFLGTLNIRCRTIIGIQKWTIILTTTRVGFPCMKPIGCGIVLS